MITLKIPSIPDNPLEQTNQINIKLFTLFEQLHADAKDQEDKMFYHFICVIFAHIGLCISNNSPEKFNALLTFIANENQKTQIKENETIH